MRTLAALFFVFFLLAFLVVLLIWAIQKLRRRKSQTSMILAIVFGAAWIISLTGVFAIKDEPTNVKSVAGKANDKKSEQKDESINRDYMEFELSFFKIVGTISSNEKEYADFLKDIESYNPVDAYDNIKKYRGSLMQNQNVIDSIDIPKKLSKETKERVGEVKSNLKTAVIDNYSALGDLLKYLESGSIKDLSNYKNSFYLMETTINEQKLILKEIRKELKISAPNYKILFRPEGTKSFYVQAKSDDPKEYFKIIHHITTSVDSSVSVVWIYSPDNKLKEGERPNDDIDPVVEYMSATNEINYSDGKESIDVWQL